MKKIISHYILILFLAGIFSCKKDSTYLDSTTEPTPFYHVSFYDHKTNKIITGLEAVLVRNIYFNDYNSNSITLNNNATGSITVKSDASGTFNFNPFCRCTNQYLKLSKSSFVDALYEVNDRSDPTLLPVHTSGGSAGANVVYTKLIRKEGNDFYFSADLYRKATIDLHIKQVSSYSDTTIVPIFNAAVYGTDPTNLSNIFETNDLLGKGILLSNDKKIDTTIRVFAFGDYLNKISWSVYGIVYDAWEDLGRKYISKGDLDVKIFPSDTTTNITISF